MSHFKEGQFVKKGELLAQIDPRTYQAQLDQAEANLARDQAHLENGQIDLSRYIPLQKRGFAPQQQVSTQQAMIAQEQATIKADQAAIEYAKAELSYTSLVAPFDGVTGIRLLDVGNIIQPSRWGRLLYEPASVVVTQVQPISVIFTLAATDIPQIQDALAKGQVKVIALNAGRQDRARHRHPCRNRQPGQYHLWDDKSKGNLPQSASPVVAGHVCYCPRRHCGAG